MANWYIVESGYERGPFTDQQIKRFAELGKINRESLLHTGDATKERAAKHIKGLFPNVRQMPPPLIPDLPELKNRTTDFINSEPQLWNSLLIRISSLFFTFGFGAYLTALNWKNLGEHEKAKRSMYWFYAAVALFLFPTIIPDSPIGTGFSRFLFLVGFIGWANSKLVKEQADFINLHYGTIYTRRSFLKPIGVWCACFSVFILAVIVRGGTESPGSQENLVRCDFVDFEFDVPKGWVLKSIPGLEYKTVRGPTRDKFTPNYIIMSHPNSGSLRDFTKTVANETIDSSKDFKMIREGSFETNHSDKAYYYVIRNTSLVVGPLIQTTYNFSSPDKFLTITFSSLAGDKDRYAELLEASMRSFRFK